MRRIEFISQDDPLYILPFFAEFFRSFSREFHITQVSCCRAMGSRSRTKLIKELFLLYRPLGFCRLMGRAGIAKVLSVYPARRDAARYWSIQQLCRAYGVTFRTIGSPNEQGFVNGLRERAADLLISVACPYILKAPVLSAAPMGCINIHHAPLPRYRGMMPTFWQLYHGEPQVGVTVHYVNEKIDDGEVLLQESLDVLPAESLDHLIRRSKVQGAHCLARVVRELPLPRGQALLEQLSAEESYFTFPTPQEIRNFHRKGLRAI